MSNDFLVIKQENLINYVMLYLSLATRKLNRDLAFIIDGKNSPCIDLERFVTLFVGLGEVAELYVRHAVIAVRCLGLLGTPKRQQ